jgi:hypothetical protein
VLPAGKPNGSELLILLAQPSKRGAGVKRGDILAALIAEKATGGGKKRGGNRHYRRLTKLTAMRILEKTFALMM